MSDGPDIAHAADGRLAYDVRCVSCGHNLRGLSRDGVCVECAAPIGWSIRGAAYLSTNIRWLETVRSGVATVTLLLPWIWVPLVWPWLAWGLWKLARPRPGDADTEGMVQRPATRIALALLPLIVMPAMVVLACLATAGSAGLGLEFALSPRTNPRVATIVVATAVLGGLFVQALACVALGRVAAGPALRAIRVGFVIVAIASASAGVLLTVAALHYGAVLGPTVIGDAAAAGFAAVGALLAVASILLFLPALIGVWRLLDTSVLQARSLREIPPCWQRATPGLLRAM